MRETPPFSTLLIEALRLSTKRRFHLVYLSLWGLLAVASYFTVSTDDTSLSLPQEDLTALLTWANEHIGYLIALVFLTLGFSFLQALLRGPLLLTLEDTLLQKKSIDARAPLTLERLVQSSGKSLLFEFLYLLVTLVLMSITLLPILLAYFYNPAVIPALIELSLIFSLFIVGLLFFVKEYALFYSLLAKTHLRQSLDLSYALFRKNLGQSLLFGALLLGLSFIFTFLLDSAIITSAALVPNDIFTTTFFVFLFSGAFGLFENSLRLLFFHTLAESEKPKVAKEKVLAEKSISENPA